MRHLPLPASPRARRRGRRVSLLSLILAGLLAVTVSCTTHAGAAAVVGGKRIEVNTLQGLVKRGTNPGSLQAFQGQQGLQNRELTLLVQRVLISRVADRLGVSITDQQASKVKQQFVKQAGGEKAFEQQVGQAGIAPQDLPPAVYDEALRQAIVAKLGHGNSTKGDALYAKQMQQEANDIGVAISPRFGRWDNTTLSVVAADHPLSSPGKGDTPVTAGP